MKLEKVESLISVLSAAEKHRVKPDKDIGCCIGGDGIFMRVGSKEICVVSSIYYQGNVSKWQEVKDMLPFIQKKLPEYEFYYNEGWVD